MKASDFLKRKRLIDKNNNTSFILFILVTFILVNLLNIEYCFTFYVNSITILLLLFFLFGIFFLITAPIEIYILAKFKISHFIGLFSLICFISIFTGKYITDIQAKLSKEKAKIIKEALEKYKTEKSEFPVEITELMPEYLLNIPSSYMGWKGKPYVYHREKDGGYYITFPAYNGGYYISTTYNNEWLETE